MIKIFKNLYYIKPEEKEEVENFIESKELDVPLTLVLNSFYNFMVNDPMITVIEDDSGNKILKVIGILDNRVNSNYSLFNHALTSIKKFNHKSNNYKIIINRVNGSIVCFKGSISSTEEDFIIFEMASSNRFLYNLLV